MLRTDYLGDGMVVPGDSRHQNYSLVIKDADRIVEQWSQLKRWNCWRLELAADETIRQVLPLGVIGGGQDQPQVLVITRDATGQRHWYTLLPDNVVVQEL